MGGWFESDVEDARDGGCRGHVVIDTDTVRVSDGGGFVPASATVCAARGWRLRRRGRPLAGTSLTGRVLKARPFQRRFWKAPTSGTASPRLMDFPCTRVVWSMAELTAR